MFLCCGEKVGFWLQPVGFGRAVVFTGMSIISSLAAEAHDYFRHVKPLGADSWYPYYSHTTPIRILKDMGIVWEAYQKGVPLLGVPGITLDSWNGKSSCFSTYSTHSFWQMSAYGQYIIGRKVANIIIFAQWLMTVVCNCFSCFHQRRSNRFAI